MMRAVLIGLVALSLTACGTLDGARQYVAVQGAAAMDRAHEDALWTLCNGISVGAWRRAYAGDPARAAAWEKLCAQPRAVPAGGQP